MSNTIAKTRVGTFEGEDLGHAVAFRGIPYALPPVGKRRFRPPEPHPPIAKTYDATKFRPSCLQPPSEIFPQTGPTEMSEDCLYLNVWTPAPDAKGRPVMVWIHGGAFVSGSGAFPWYDGAKLASFGVVVVTINYRLGPFGFLHLEPVLGNRYTDASNLGMQDQVAALEWVRDHIENFGGDPENVTVFGESAGAMSVATLLGTPAAKGLFERAIAQSGAAHNVLPKKIAGRIAEKFAESLEKVAGEDLRPGRVLEEIPARAILDAGMETLAHFSGAAETERSERQREGDAAILLPFQPVLDDSFLPRRPLEAIAEGAAAGIPLLTGTTRDEYSLFIFTDRGFHGLDRQRVIRRIKKTISTAKELELAPFGSGNPSSKNMDGTQPEQIYDFYVEWLRRNDRPAEPKHVWAAVATDVMFRVPAVRLAEAHAPHAPTWVYLFSRPSPMANGHFGAPHAAEIPFVFGNLDDPAAKLFCGDGPDVKELSAEMRSLWTSFAAGKPPSSPRVPEWPPYSPESGSRNSRRIVKFGESVEVIPDPEAEKLRIWEGIL